MLSMYYGLIRVFLAGVVVQIFLAGYGIFASAEGATEHQFVDNFVAHAVLGWLLGLLSLILLLLAVGGGLSGRVKKVSGLLFVLLVLQFVFAGVGASVALIGGLHAVNAVVILSVGWVLVKYAREEGVADRTAAAAESLHPLA
jgi:hypothetical protein